MNSPAMTARIFANDDETFVKCRQVFADANIPIKIENEENQQFKVGDSGPTLELCQPSLIVNRIELSFWDGREFQVIIIPHAWVSGIYIRATIRD
jgi:hypothetical protein